MLQNLGIDFGYFFLHSRSFASSNHIDTHSHNLTFHALLGSASSPSAEGSKSWMLLQPHATTTTTSASGCIVVVVSREAAFPALVQAVAEALLPKGVL